MLVAAREFLFRAIDKHAGVGAEAAEGEIPELVTRHCAGPARDALQHVIAILWTVGAVDFDMVGGKVAAPEGDVLALPGGPARFLARDQLRFERGWGFGLCG
jgi:hypothetical protein